MRIILNESDAEAGNLPACLERVSSGNLAQPEILSSKEISAQDGAQCQHFSFEVKPKTRAGRAKRFLPGHRPSLHVLVFVVLGRTWMSILPAPKAAFLPLWGAVGWGGGWVLVGGFWGGVFLGWGGGLEGSPPRIRATRQNVGIPRPAQAEANCRNLGSPAFPVTSDVN